MPSELYAAYMKFNAHTYRTHLKLCSPFLQITCVCVCVCVGGGGGGLIIEYR